MHCGMRNGRKGERGASASGEGVNGFRLGQQSEASCRRLRSIAAIACDMENGFPQCVKVSGGREGGVCFSQVASRCMGRSELDSHLATAACYLLSPRSSITPSPVLHLPQEFLSLGRAARSQLVARCCHSAHLTHSGYGLSTTLRPPPTSLLSSPIAVPVPFFSSVPGLHVLPLIRLCGWIAMPTRTPCIGLAPSAMARMTAVAMLLPGLLLALLAAAIASIAVPPRDTDSEEGNNPLMLPSASLPHGNATVMCGNATCGPDSRPNAANAITASLQHAHALDVPIHSLHALSPGAIHLLVLYSALATLGSLLWGMGVTHTQVRAWVHQQGLAVTAGLMKLKSASKRLLQPGMFSLLHSLRKRAFSGVQKEQVNAVRGEVTTVQGEVNAVREEVIAAKGEMAEQKQSTTLQFEEAERRRVAEMRGQVEERERELAAVKGGLAALRGELVEQNVLMKLDVDLQIRQSEGNQKTAWEVSAKGTLSQGMHG
ncbi:unnamed protein product [Closterium sp. NIES-64]|nr:unnamed protein product [Closterium sp. NIES-64]